MVEHFSSSLLEMVSQTQTFGIDAKSSPYIWYYKMLISLYVSRLATQCLIPELELSRPQPEIWITISDSYPWYPNLIKVVWVLVPLPECMWCIWVHMFICLNNICAVVEDHMLFATLLFASRVIAYIFLSINAGQNYCLLL